MSGAGDPIKFDVPPGIWRRGSSASAQGRYYDCDGIRFKNGLPEKQAGWLKRIVEPIIGHGRGAMAWATRRGTQMIHTGTWLKAYAATDQLQDITPLRDSGTLGTDPFEVTDTSDIVVVNDTAHGLSVGAQVHFSGASSGGGITIDGTYTVIDASAANEYTIQHSAPATSTDATTGGAAVAYEYEVNPGLSNPGLGLGFGVGPFGGSTYGTPRDVEDGIEVALRYWSFNRYGDQVLVSYTGGTLFLWDEPNNDDRAVAIAGAPTYTRASFVTAEGYIFALGTDDGDMVIRWPARDDPTDWNPDLEDDGNARRLRSGNKMMNGAVFAESVNVMWSDTSLFLANYSGQPLIYDTPVVGVSCGLIGQGSFAVTDRGILWMGPSDFHVYAGGMVDLVPNRLDIRDYVYANLNRSAVAKIAGVYDDENNSVRWTVPFGDAIEPGHYVEVSLDDWSWWFGTWVNGVRTAMAQLPAAGGSLIMVGNDDADPDEAFFYTHNVGFDADGAPLDWFLEQGILGLADGDRDAAFAHYQPDYDRQEGIVTVTLTAYDRPRGQANNNPLMAGVYLIDPTTEFEDIDVSGRYFVRRIEQVGVLAGDWRGGVDQLWVAGAGNAA